MRRLLALAAVVITSAFALSAVAQAGDPDTAHYPDLQTLKPTDVRLVRDRSAGQKLLRFSNTVANLGQGVLELRPVNNAVTGKTEAYQRVYTHDASGGWYLHSESPVGTFEFHSAHDHWHLEGFATYELRNVNPDGSVGATVYASSGKVSFCVIDIVSVAPTLEHAGSQTYRTCSQTAV